MAPLLAVVTGAPATGKTPLAERLSADLRLPLVAKDDVKQALFRTLGAGDMESSRRLSGAAFEVLFTVGARMLEAGTGLVLEGNFGRGDHEERLRPLLELAQAVQIHCWATRERTLHRYSTRARDEMHFDEASLPRVMAALDAGLYEALDLGVPTLRVDTSAGYDPPLEEVVEFVQRHAGR